MNSEKETIQHIFKYSTDELQKGTDHNTRMQNMIRSYVDNGFKSRAQYLFHKYEKTMHENNVNTIRLLLLQ